MKNKLPLTEKRIKTAQNLNKLSTLQIIKLMNQEEQKTANVVKSQLAKIAKAVNIIVSNFKKGGRLFYIGAGTSGRLGICDAAECPPTFGTSPKLVQGILAGGHTSLWRAKEGAEDNIESAIKDLKKRNLSYKDTLVGISASGNTPYVAGGLKYASKLKTKTIAVTCNLDAKIISLADISIVLRTGPEILTGSTRLKAATAEKMVLNMLSTASLVKLGRVYKNYMIDLKAGSKKLKNRSLRILQELANLNEAESKRLIRLSKGNLKTAVLMGIKNINLEKAKKLLKKNDNNLSKAI